MSDLFRTFAPNEASDPDAAFTPGRLVCLIALLILVAYPDVVLGSHSFFYRDFGFFGYPLAHYHRTRFWEGEVPLWNPLNNCGLPFLAQWNTMVLYPPSLIYLLFPLPWSLNYFCLGHLLLAGVGMYLLAHRWVGSRLAASVAGLAYAWNGLTLHSLMWPNNIAALAWMPLVVLLAEKSLRQGGRLLIVAALVTATQMLSGAPEIILFTWLLLGTLTIGLLWRVPLPRKRVLSRFTLLVALVTGLTAAQMLPFLDLLKHSQRDRNFASDVWAMPAWGWANLVVPAFQTSPSILGVVSQDEQQWTSSYYLGIGVLALGLIAMWHRRERTVLLLTVIAGAGLFLALGKNGYIYDWLRRMAPGIGFVRFPIKFVVLTLFSLPLLAAFGLNWCQSRTDPGLARRSLCRIGLTLAVPVLAILAVAYWFGFPQDSWPATWRSGCSRALFLALALVAINQSVRVQSSPKRIFFGFAMLALCGLDILTHVPRQNPTVISAAYQPLHVKRVVAAQHGESRAMLSRKAEAFLSHAAVPNELNYYLGNRRALFSNCNLLEDIPQINGFFSLYLKEEVEVRGQLYDTMNELRSPLADFLGASYISSPNNPFDWAGRSASMPLATGGQKPAFADASATLNCLTAPGFDPRRDVCLPPEASAFITVSNRSTLQIAASRVAADKIQLEVEAAEPALVVLAQAFYHPWTASVDGRRVRIWRANHAFQALEVPAGRHQVKLAYHDRSFHLGAGISVITLLVCLSSLLISQPAIDLQPKRKGWGLSSVLCWRWNNIRSKRKMLTERGAAAVEMPS